MSAPYIDTSALAKWYLNEPRSDEFEKFITAQKAAWISRLTVVEFRCLLARRRRAGEITARIDGAVYDAFERDIRQGALGLLPLQDQHVASAAAMIGRLPRHPLRTLDALHLAIALDAKADAVATADRIMASASKDLGLKVIAFF